MNKAIFKTLLIHLGVFLSFSFALHYFTPAFGRAAEFSLFGLPSMFFAGNAFAVHAKNNLREVLCVMFVCLAISTATILIHYLYPQQFRYALSGPISVVVVSFVLGLPMTLAHRLSTRPEEHSHPD